MITFIIITTILVMAFDFTDYVVMKEKREGKTVPDFFVVMTFVIACIFSPVLAVRLVHDLIF